MLSKLDPCKRVLKKKYDFIQIYDNFNYLDIDPLVKFKNQYKKDDRVIHNYTPKFMGIPKNEKSSIQDNINRNINQEIHKGSITEAPQQYYSFKELYEDALPNIRKVRQERIGNTFKNIDNSINKQKIYPVGIPFDTNPNSKFIAGYVNQNKKDFPSAKYANIYASNNSSFQHSQIPQNTNSKNVPDQYFPSQSRFFPIAKPQKYLQEEIKDKSNDLSGK